MAESKHLHVVIEAERNTPQIFVLVAGTDSYGEFQSRERVPLSATRMELIEAAYRAIDRWADMKDTHLAGIEKVRRKSATSPEPGAATPLELLSTDVAPDPAQTGAQE